MNTKLRKHKLAVAGVLAVVIVGGGASIAAAASNSTTADAASVDEGETGGETADGPDGDSASKQEEQSPVFTASVTAPAQADERDGQEQAGSEDQESAALQGLATVTAQQAELAALAAVSGTAGKAELGNENGFVVYSVEVTGTDGSITDVTIDAGIGAVLAQEVHGAQDSEDLQD